MESSQLKEEINERRLEIDEMNLQLDDLLEQLNNELEQAARQGNEIAVDVLEGARKSFAIMRSGSRR